ncbi:DnaJ domain-containing protein [uncultured Cohaesibacter sp.]|uniref:DnaJ domain-containing protein n=1 Tax=uncultured Cohaesibacter sp. TaxID=1002546 RepID=UPI0029C87B29|nr:DnaJ domain-containing protein [uncultured Cohaesibacter sp.]
MIYLLAGLLIFVAVILLARWAAYANPGDVLLLGYRIVGGLLGLFAAFLLFRGQWMLGIAVGFMAWGLFQRKPSSAGADRTSGRGSTVRTAALEMTLDHDTGIIIGRVLAGSFEGRELDGLSETELHSLWQEIGSDRESRDLLEAYLDGRSANWRDAFDADPATGEAGTADSGPMTKEEAYEILGLPAGAGEAEVVAAHRRLMKRVHPDQGGSTFLAAKINAAKAVLLRKHG